MKKIKNMLKKGGIADIVTLMVIIGLVIALIIAVVLPTITSTEGVKTNNDSLFTTVTNDTNDLAGK